MKASDYLSGSSLERGSDEEPRSRSASAFLRANTDVGIATRGADIGRSLGAGAVEVGAMSGRGLGTTLEVAGRASERATRQAFESAGIGKVYDYLNFDIPWWANPYEILSRPLGEAGEALGGVAEAIRPPEARRNLATDISEGVGQLGAQIAAAIMSGGASTAVSTAMLFGQGVDQMDQLIDEYKPGDTGIATDSARLLGGQITAATERIGLDKILERVPPKIKNSVLRYFTDIGIAGGIEAVQEVSESVMRNLTAAAIVDDEIPILGEGLKREAIVAGGAGAIGRGALELLLPGRQRGGDIQKAKDGLGNTLTQEDLDSPISQTLGPEILQEGRETVRGAEVASEVNKILEEAGLPTIGSRVVLEYGDGRVETGRLADTFTTENQELGLSDRGIQVDLDSGGRLEEFLSDIRRGTVRVSREPEAQPEAPEGPDTSSTSFEPTAEWQTIPEGTVLPPGLEIRMNLETGIQEARKPPGASPQAGPAESIATTEAQAPTAQEFLRGENAQNAPTEARTAEPAPSVADEPVSVAPVAPSQAQEAISTPDVAAAPEPAPTASAPAEATPPSQTATSIPPTGAAPEPETDTDARARFRRELNEAGQSTLGDTTYAVREGRQGYTVNIVSGRRSGTTIGGDPRGGGFSRGQAVQRAFQDAFPDSAEPAPEVKGSQNGNRLPPSREDETPSGPRVNINVVPTSLIREWTLPADTDISARAANKSDQLVNKGPFRGFASTNEGGRLSVDAIGETLEEARRNAAEKLAIGLRRREADRRRDQEAARSGQVPVEDDRERQRIENIAKMEGAGFAQPETVEPAPEEADIQPTPEPTEDQGETAAEEPSPLDDTGGPALESAPAEEARQPREEREAGRGTPSGGATDQPSTRERDGERPGLPGGVGTGEGTVSVPAGGDTGQRRSDAGERVVPSDGQPDRVEPDRAANLNPVKRTDYEITEADELGTGGAVAKFNDNVRAIRLLKKLEAENRLATPEEQQILVRYVGWGGLKSAFPNRSTSGEDVWNKGWEQRGRELKELLTPEEYQTASRSVLDAHYTSVPVIRAIYQVMDRLGFKGGRILEPSVGTGNFFGLMPKGMRSKSAVTGIEFDHITGGIARQLYQSMNIMAPVGFQDAPIADNHFDAAIGNPPFGAQGVPGAKEKDIKNFSIHNYFFARTVNKLRPGGVMSMVVTKNFMDKPGGRERSWIANRTRLLGAIRLPNTAFQENAGTEVTTDIVILQKLPESEWGTTGKDWIDVGQMADPLGGEPMNVNQYFIDNPQFMLGRMERSGTMRQKAEPTLAPDGRDIQDALDQAVQEAVPEDVYQPSSTVEPTEDMVLKSADAPPETEEFEVGSFFQSGEKLYRREYSPDGAPAASEVTADTQWTEKQTLGEGRLKRLKGMVKVRNAARKLLRLEAANDTDAMLKLARKQLNGVYDQFVKSHGYLSDQANERLFRDDPDAPLLLALESNYDPGVTSARAKKLGVKPRRSSAEKAALFSKRVIQPYTPVTKADNAQDALTISLADKGFVDIEHMSDLTGKPEAELAKELHDDLEEPLIYFNPVDSIWQTRAEYLSGNVKRKEQEARAAGLMRNAEDLRDVFPADVKSGDLRVRMGASWVDGKDYAAFANHLLGENTRSSVVYIPSTGGYAVTITGMSTTANTSKWGTQRAPADTLIDKVLNNKEIVVRDRHSDGSSTVNTEATLAAQQKAEEIREEFSEWLFKDAERRERLTKFYNDNFNTNIEPKFDGSHLTLPGKVPDTIIKLRRHQINAIWRGISKRTALLDHVVGAGKTFTVVAQAMELKRMGLARKPMIAVPNHLVTQWSTSFYQLYPGARILAATKKDFEAKNRKRLLARIATGDWDAVIMAHSSFGFIRMSPDYEMQFMEKQIAEIQASIDILRREEGKGSRRRSDLERQRDNITKKMKELADKPKDDLLTFEELGVDQLFVDESHEFKNLYFITQRRGMLGLGNPKGSKRAFDMFLKTRWLLDRQNGKGVIFATGTPVSNSLTEMYTIQRYLGLAELEDRGILSFDAWLNNFGLDYSDYELDGTGVKYKQVNRLRQLTNMTELMAMYRQYADSVTLDQIKEVFREENEGREFPVPRVKGGKRENVVVPRSQQQGAFFEKIVQRAQNLTPGGKDNMLAITGDARKAALDIRLVGGSGDYEKNKSNIAADRIKELHERWAEDRGTQLVFLDLSIPLSAAKKTNADAMKFIEAVDKARARVEALLRADGSARDIEEAEEALTAAEEALAKKYSEDDLAALLAARGGFSVYDDLREKLIARGIPEKEIAFIHDYNTDAQKADLFDQVNAGQIRVLLGSTSKMGAGTNVQERVVALHHLDVPWRPSDVEQREGRVIRQGNSLLQKYGDKFELEIVAYATEQTYDARMWQTQEQKLLGIEGLRNYKGEREMEEVAAASASAAEMKAAATGNPLILEDVQLADKIRKLESQQRSHRRQQYDLESDQRRFTQWLEDYPAILPGAQKDAAQAEAYLADPFQGEPPTVIVDGQKYTSFTEAERAVADAYNRQKEAADGKAFEFSVTIDGTEYSSKSKAQEHLIDVTGGRNPVNVTIGGKQYRTPVRAAKAFVDAGGRSVSGEIAGFPFKVTIDLSETADSYDEITVQLQGAEDTYTETELTDSQNEPLKKAREAIRHLGKIVQMPIQRAEMYETRLERAKRELPEVEAELGKPFAKAAELAQTKERHQEVRRLLTLKPEELAEERQTQADIARFESEGGQVKVDRLDVLESAIGRRAFLKSLGGGLTTVTVAGRARAFSESLADHARKPESTLKSVLDLIAKNSASDINRDLANRIGAKVSDDMGLKAVPVGTKLDYQVPAALNGAYGVTLHDRDTGKVDVYLRDDEALEYSGLTEETILHEAVHAVMLRGFGRFSRNGADLLNKTPKNDLERAAKKLLEVQQELVRRVNAMSKADREQFLSDNVWAHGIQDPDEFMSYALTSREMQVWLQDQPLTEDEASGQARPIPQDVADRRSLWGKFLGAIRQWFGIVKRSHVNALEAALDASYSIIENLGRTATPSSEQVKGEDLFKSVLPKRPAGPRRAHGVKFDKTETEERLQRAKGGVASQETLVQLTGEWLTRLGQGFSRHFIELPNNRKFADIIQQLRKLEAAPQAAKEQTIRILRRITDGMNNDDLDLFTRKVILDDLMFEVDQEHLLPFGLTAEDVPRELAKVDEALESRPDLIARVRERKLIVRDVANQLVAAGVLNREQVNNPAYYRHQVLDYARAQKQYAKSSQGKLKAPYWARRKGSALDINANFLEAELDWMHKAFTDIATARTIEWIKNSGHNLRASVVQAARDHNKLKVKELLDKDLAENMMTKNGRVTSPLNEEWTDYNKRIAMGLKFVREAIEHGELDVPQNLRRAADQLVGESTDSEVRLFPLLSWILDNDLPGARGAAIAFKAINQRKAWMIARLEKDYVDPLDLGTPEKPGEAVRRFAPEGYTPWQPEEGKLLYTAKTLPEHVIDSLMAKIAEDPQGPISAADMQAALAKTRSVLAIGSTKYQMVLPEEIATTLNSLRGGPEEGMFEHMAAVPQRMWKQYVLINPRAVLRYNLNNLSGDLDAVIAGSPRIVKRLPQAIKELWGVMQGTATPSARFKEAVDRGVFDSGLSVQEIADINALSEFQDLADKADQSLGRKFILSPLGKVWRGLRKGTMFRENWLRYAAYLDYVERLEAGESMEKIGYGAAKKEMVDGVADLKDRAALLAREMVGDYGAISAYGGALRKYIYPFWSWKEINTKRYWRLGINAWDQGIGKGLTTTGFIAASLGVRTTAYLALRMWVVFALVNLWNNLLFGDEEDELSEMDRNRLHINLGKGEDGQIRLLRFQGALSDFLAWVGFEDARAVLSEMEKGRADYTDLITTVAAAPVKILVGGITPLITTPVETLTGLKFWPNVFEPRPIRDKWKNLASNFNLQHEYDLIFQKPSRGYGRSLQDALFYTRDADENAYFSVKGMTYDWLERVKGQGGISTFHTPRSTALYEWRLARRFGDKDAEQRARKKMRELGMTAKDIAASIKRAHPLGAIALKDRRRFLATLDSKERAQISQANKWYRKTFYGGPE